MTFDLSYNNLGLITSIRVLLLGFNGKIFRYSTNVKALQYYAYIDIVAFECLRLSVKNVLQIINLNL